MTSPCTTNAWTPRWTTVLAVGLTIAGCSRSASNRSDTTSPGAATHDSTPRVDSIRRTTSPAIVSPADLAAAACDHAVGLDSVGTLEYEPIREFLRILHADGTADSDSRQDVHFVSLDRLLAFVSDSGLTYMDVNTVGEIGGSLEGEFTTTNSDTIIHVSRDSLRTVLRSERGSLYGNLEGLAKQYDDSSNGYWGIRYCPIKDGVVARIGMQDYSLTFRRERGGLRLTRFAALEVAPD